MERRFSFFEACDRPQGGLRQGVGDSISSPLLSLGGLKGVTGGRTRLDVI